ncbi:MAG: LAGLIDADG family homing endonuclease [Methanobrevibacter sp.]|nr:LAGLIDADG family homing endonuclease [Methanobrevibacter sp.]
MKISNNSAYAPILRSDEQLINTFIKYLECGKCYFGSKDKPTQAGNFVVQKYSDIELKIIPFFNKYPILGSKSEDFKDFKEVAILIKNKEHLIKEGLLQIKNIKAGMNRGRN